MKKIMLMLVMAVAVLSVNAQTRTAVKTSDLQSSITNTIAKDYVGSTIKHATKVEANGVATYEVVVAKGTTESTLIFDKDGKFIRKDAAMAGTMKKNETKAKAGAPEKKK
jgi:hypothetical protein